MKYTIEEIRQMQEGQTFDCKSILIEPKHLATIIVAMANADGGMIAVGISDKTRRIEGVNQDKEHLNDILRTPLDFCVPSVSVTTDYVPCTDAEGRDNRVLLMHIPASPRLHANQADEVFWRVGDKSRKLTFDERLQLMYDKGERYYEDSTAYDATLDDIDMDAVKAYMKRIGYGKSAKLCYFQHNIATQPIASESCRFLSSWDIAKDKTACKTSTGILIVHIFLKCDILSLQRAPILGDNDAIMCFQYAIGLIVQRYSI